MTSNGPTVFPTLLPNQLHHAWFPEKYQLAKESAITKAEEAYEAWKHALRNQGDGIPLYGMLIQYCMQSIFDIVHNLSW